MWASVRTLWKSGTGNGGHATPVPFQVGQKTYLAIHSPRALTIVDAADGKELWSTPRRQPIGVNAPDPVVDGTKVFVTAGRGFGGAVFDVSGDNTKALWEQEGLSSHPWVSRDMEGNIFASSSSVPTPNAMQRAMSWSIK